MVVELVISAFALLFVARQGSSAPPALKFPILVSGSKPTLEEQNLVNVRSRKAARAIADGLGVITIESEKLVVYIAPSAAYPPSQLPYMVFELFGNKLFGSFNLKNAPKAMQATLINSLAQEFLQAKVDPLKDDVHIGTMMSIRGSFISGGSRHIMATLDSKEGLENQSRMPLTKGSLRGSLPSPTTVDTSLERENTVRFTTNPWVRRDVLHSAVSEAMLMYDDWFKKRWSPSEALFQQELRAAIERDPRLRGFPIAGTKELGDLNPQIRAGFESQLRSQWLDETKDPAEVDRRMAANQFEFARLDIMMGFSIGSGIGRTGFLTQIWP